MDSPSPIQLHCHATGTSPSLHHLTAIASGPIDDLDEVYDEALHYLQQHGLAVLQEKLFAAPAVATALAADRQEMGGRPGLVPDSPLSIVLDPPCVGGPVAGLQLLATDAPVEQVVHRGRVVATSLQAGDRRALFAAAIHGMEAGADADAQMGAMFAHAAQLVSDQGYGFHQVARTWLYVHPLLLHYEALNAVRDRFFRAQGLITDEGPRHLPASTGIQGAHPDGARAFMDLVAVARGDSTAGRPMRTRHQCEAFEYGSAFARGMVVDLPDSQLLYASGTASIDDSGSTVHVGDPAGQVRETYAAVQALLGLQDSGWHDAVTAVAFFKDEATWQAWHGLRAAAEIPELPLIPVFADVCRDDLLFELEVTAAR